MNIGKIKMTDGFSQRVKTTLLNRDAVAEIIGILADCGSSQEIIESYEKKLVEAKSDYNDLMREIKTLIQKEYPKYKTYKLNFYDKEINVYD